jgi:gliding motility-associated-like protein
MCKIFFSSCFLVIHFTFSWGQGIINNGANIVLGSGSYILIKDTISGNFENRSGGLIENSGTLKLEGHWVNNGGNSVFTSNSGTVELSGADQLIAGNSTTAFYSLVLSGVGTKKLLINTIVGGGNKFNRNGILNLNDRALHLNSNTLSLTNPATSAIQRSTGYVISETDSTTGYGKFSWLTGTSVSGKNFMLPFGRTDGTYISCSLSFTSDGSGDDSSGFIASTYPTSPIPGNRPLPAGTGSMDNPYGKDHSENTIDRFWVNTAFGFSTPPAANVFYEYNDDEWNNAGGGNNTIFENELGQLSFISGKWQFPTSGTVDIVNNRVAASGTSPFGIFTLANPVECPKAWFGSRDTCQQENLLFNDSSVFRKGSISAHTWDFGDATMSTDPSPLHNYSGFGNFTVTHIATLSSGCTDTVRKVIRIYPKPLADLSFNGNQCFGTPVLFTDNSHSPQGSVISRYWEFGDGQQSASTAPVVSYNAPGIYPVKLVVQNSWLCRDSLIKPVRIFRNPVAQFSAGNSCSNDSVRPQNNSFPGDAPLQKFKWDLGDGSSSMQPQPVRKYTAPGSYTIQLIVIDSNNCSDTSSNTVDINPSAKADFIFNPSKPTLEDPLVSFINQSSNSTSWDWDFGDGAGAGSFNSSHAYTDTGYFTVMLRADNDFNCPDSVSRRVYIEPIFRIYIADAFTPNGDLLNETFGPDGLAMGAKNSKLTIYNRWGAEIFSSSDITHRWDGTYNGSPVQSGVYSYLFETDDYKGARHYYSGVVTLLR